MIKIVIIKSNSKNIKDISHNNKKSGFSFIEISIVILISSLIFLSLYQMVNYASNSVRQINNTINRDAPIIPFYNQLELDITGMFVPQSTAAFYSDKFKPKKVDNRSNSNSDNKTDNKLDNKSDVQNQDTKNSENKEKEDKKVIKDIFYIKITDSGDLVLSFITTAGIKTLESDGSLKPSSFMYRVAYILQKDPKRPNTHKIIYRCDSDTQLLDVKNILDSKFQPSYELISGIKNLKIKFTVYEFVEVESDDKDNKDNKAKVSAKKESKNIVLSEWSEEENFKKYKALIPAYLSLEGVFIQPNMRKNNKEIEYAFNFEFKVPSYAPYL